MLLHAMQRLLHKPNVNGLIICVQDQATPFCMAVLNGREDTACALIEAGADVNVQCLEVGNGYF
jgi:2-C-methyl-D-erythritol 4-phosphate cytidylyltransferase